MLGVMLLSVLLDCVMNYRESDMSKPDAASPAPIVEVGPPEAMADSLLIGKSETYTAGTATVRHTHPVAQVLFAIEGVMQVETALGQWIAPPSRAIWIPPGEWHQVRMLSRVRMRSVYVRPDAVQAMPAVCAVLAVTPLLRELLLAAVQLQPPHPPASRAERLIRVLLDELQVLPSLPLALPMLLMIFWRSGDHVGGQTADWFNWRAKFNWLLMVLRDRWMAFDLLSLALMALVLHAILAVFH